MIISCVFLCPWPVYINSVECTFIQDGVCAYSVTAATSTDGKVVLFIDKWFPPPGESTVNISLQLPTSEEYYITVSACNALSCGPPSSPVFISKAFN